MTKLLKDYLRVAMEDNKAAARRLADQPHVRKLGYYDAEGKLKPVRELLLSDKIEGTNLIQTEVLATVIEGAEPAKCFLDILPTYRTKGNSLRVPYGASGTYAEEYPEGAEIKIKTQDYSSAVFAPKKYAQRPLISKEMVEDANVDVIEQEVRKAGYAVTNAAEKNCLSEILEDSNQEHDTGGSNQGLKAVISARAIVRGLGMIPDFVVMHPEAEAMVLRDFVAPASPGADNVLRGTGMPDGYLGLKWRVCNVEDASSSHTWDYDSDGDIGMLVIDSTRVGGIHMPRPLTVDNYEDPVHDLVGMTVSMRMDCQSFIADAAARVEF